MNRNKTLILVLALSGCVWGGMTGCLPSDEETETPSTIIQKPRELEDVEEMYNPCAGC